MSADEVKTSRRARRAQLGQDLFATQAERPFLFPPKFTFVFRAFTTIDGVAKGLDPKFDLARVSQPYLRELADLRDGSATTTAIKELAERLGLRPVDLAAVVKQPRSVAATAERLKRIEDGEVKLRVRTLEVERILDRVELRQKTLLDGVSAAGCLHLAQELAQGAPVFAAHLTATLAAADPLGAALSGGAAGCTFSVARLGRLVPGLARLPAMLALYAALRLGWACWAALSALGALDAQRLRFANARDDM